MIETKKRYSLVIPSETPECYIIREDGSLLRAYYYPCPFDDDCYQVVVEITPALRQTMDIPFNSQYLMFSVTPDEIMRIVGEAKVV